MANSPKPFSARACTRYACAETNLSKPHATSSQKETAMAKDTALEFNEDLINLIRKHYPRALQGDIEQNSRCASNIAVALGGMVAFAYRLNGQVIGRSVMQSIITSIINNAASIDQKAGDLIRQDMPKLLN
jgi:hypothetical protein